MGFDPNEVANRFKYHTTQSEARVFAHNQVRERCRRLAAAFANSLPVCRETALALTKIEEAMFFANAAIARAPETFQELEEVVRTDTLDQLAKEAYNAYGAATGFKNFRGDPMPPWENLGTTIQSAWVASVHATVKSTEENA